MYCSFCGKLITNPNDWKKTFGLVSFYVRKRYGDFLHLEWKFKVLESLHKLPEPLMLCPSCIGELANLSLEGLIGKRSKFIERWFIRSWEGL